MERKHIFMPLLLCLLVCASCKKADDGVQIAVFVPGILADSPIYSMMTDGAKSALDAYTAGGGKAALSISEAGTNQAQWQGLLTALSSSGKYDLILSSSPSLPMLIAPIVEQFSAQKFVLLDAAMTGCSAAAAAHFNQREQSYLAGYAAALSSKTGKLGLIAAQEYPIMSDVILPGYKEGAAAAIGSASVDFRIVGNWYDATKGAEITRAMADSGVDVILPIAAGASQGVISAAREEGIRLVWFDNADFDRAPDLITACATLDQERLAEEMTSAFLNGTVRWGETMQVGASEGYVRIVLSQDTSLVSDEMREKVNEMALSIMRGEVVLHQD